MRSNSLRWRKHSISPALLTAIRRRLNKSFNKARHRSPQPTLWGTLIDVSYYIDVRQSLLPHVGKQQLQSLRRVSLRLLQLQGTIEYDQGSEPVAITIGRKSKSYRFREPLTWGCAIRVLSMTRAIGAITTSSISFNESKPHIISIPWLDCAHGQLLPAHRVVRDMSCRFQTSDAWECQWSEPACLTSRTQAVRDWKRARSTNHS
jgi:hypothetical protein